ncbi:hypothetical protein DYB28_009276 [Aphanomyces astaci]|uniref:Uncharacterized protein n=1 Tax=Aphanomyces astaci TaxID=112090 RepID=A0A9X8E226_APHAT|nr:hypothetical protein DYB28_009276 [Aphanomyces astaci]
MSSPPGTADLVLRRTISQEMQYAPTMSLPSTRTAGALPFVAYPSEIAAVQRLGQHLGNQVHAAVQEQFSSSSCTYRRSRLSPTTKLLLRLSITASNWRRCDVGLASVGMCSRGTQGPVVQCTKVQMRKFMDQYQAYAHEVNIANAQRPDGAQIQRAPMCTCIDPLSVERIAYWEIGKASHELTEEDWKVFFLGAKDSDPVDISKLDVAMAKLKMDTTVQSAESRGLGFRGGTRAPVNGGELMKLNENRSHKKDARVCKRWLADYMRRYGEIEPLMADKLPAAANPRLGRPPRSWPS